MAKDNEVITVLLQKLEDYLKSLKPYKKIDQKELEESNELLAFIERRLQLAAQVCIDLGNHLISIYSFKSPESYAEIFDILAKEKVISKELSLTMRKIVGFRNILVHDYLSVDVKIVKDVLHNTLGYFERFSSAIVRFIKR